MARDLTQPRSPKTRLVDLGYLYDSVKKLAEESEMAISAFARILIKHALKFNGTIGFVPDHRQQSADQSTPGVPPSNVGFHPPDLR